jgi:hypothetical protein
MILRIHFEKFPWIFLIPRNFSSELPCPDRVICLEGGWIEYRLFVECEIACGFKSFILFLLEIIQMILFLSIFLQKILANGSRLNFLSKSFRIALGG